MKRILLIAALLLPLLAPAAFGGNISKNQISTFISECQRYEGVEVVQLGGLATMALRASLRVAASDDPEVREMLKLITGVKRISVLNYEQCAPDIQDKISRKLNRMLDGSDLLIETRDGNELMQIYGLYDERTEAVRDFVLFSPSDCTLVCLFGSIPMETVSNILNEK